MMKEEALSRAQGMQRAGNVAEAEAICPYILPHEPYDAQTLWLPGLLTPQAWRGKLTLELLQKSIRPLNHGMDAVGFARGIEAYREMLKTWCAAGGDHP
jgi:hypothetical protein